MNPIEVEVEVEVEMLAFGREGEVRTVSIPYDEFSVVPPKAQLELVFRYGQNDFQPKRQPSVSVGDVIRLHGHRYAVASAGFRRLPS